jgi:hypothetical protein
MKLWVQTQGNDLSALVVLQPPQKEKRPFFSALVFIANVPVQAVIYFWRNPGFLGVGHEMTKVTASSTKLPEIWSRNLGQPWSLSLLGQPELVAAAVAKTAYQTFEAAYDEGRGLTQEGFVVGLYPDSKVVVHIGAGQLAVSFVSPGDLPESQVAP